MKVLFIDGSQNHDPHQRTSRATGGILNSLTLIPNLLAKQGWEVFVKSTYNKTEDVDGVYYIDSTTSIPKWDVTVFNRDVLPKDFVVYCKEQGSKLVWWLHDIVQTTYLKDDTFRVLDKIIALSDYCKDTYSDFYDINKEKFLVIPNGVDKSLFYPGEYEKRDSKLVITASALVKGYLPIPTVFENLKRHEPDIDFRIYSSQELHGLSNSNQQNKYLQEMEKAGAHIYHPVSQEVLAHILRKAHCLLMPNSYPEICSNLLLQAQASGCPVVTSNIGSAPEFIKNRETGVYTEKYYPHDCYSWIVEYTNLVLEIFLDKQLHKTISEQSPRDVKNWEQIGRIWDEELRKVVVE